MSIKIKNRDPKSTDFSPNDIIVNVKDGTIFYKSDKGLFKLQGDNLNTPTTDNSAESTINITAFSGSFQYITASVIDVDADTIRFGGIPFRKIDVQNLKQGLFPTTESKSQDETYTQFSKPQAIISPVDESTYQKFTIAARVGQFVSGTLFFDQNLSGSNNYATIGTGTTNITLSGSITGSIINGGSF